LANLFGRRERDAYRLEVGRELSFFLLKSEHGFISDESKPLTDNLQAAD
jgi:hypothetical protein